MSEIPLKDSNSICRPKPIKPVYFLRKPMVALGSERAAIRCHNSIQSKSLSGASSSTSTAVRGKAAICLQTRTRTSPHRDSQSAAISSCSPLDGIRGPLISQTAGYLLKSMQRLSSQSTSNLTSNRGKAHRTQTLLCK